MIEIPTPGPAQPAPPAPPKPQATQVGTLATVNLGAAGQPAESGRDSARASDATRQTEN